MPQIHVVCHRPGMHRGGRRNPKHAAYDVGVHSPTQLRELLADPEITLLYGEKLTADDIDVIEARAAATQAEADPEPKKPAAGKKA